VRKQVKEAGIKQEEIAALVKEARKIAKKEK